MGFVFRHQLCDENFKKCNIYISSDAINEKPSKYFVDKKFALENGLNRLGLML